MRHRGFTFAASPRGDVRQCLWLLLALSIPSTAAAQTFSLDSEPAMLSVGDLVTVTFTSNTPFGIFGADMIWTYRLPSNAAYVNGSARITGSNISDDEYTIEVSESKVVFTIHDKIPQGQTEFILQLRATGSIGTMIRHEGFTGGSVPSTTYYDYPTRIEDENGVFLESIVQDDTYIDEEIANFNFGRSTSLKLKSGVNPKRGLLHFDAASMIPSTPVGYEVARAYVEVFAIVPSGAFGSMTAYEVTEPWSEGAADSAACSPGEPTWSSSDCSQPWDTDSFNLVGATSFNKASGILSIEVTALVQDWWKGDPDNGVLLRATSSTSEILRLAAKERSGDQTLAARLVVVVAPDKAYEQEIDKETLAEITPNVTVATAPVQRFTYTARPEIESNDTGLNRLMIRIPPSFTLSGVQNVRVDDVDLLPRSGSTLSPGEFEILDATSTLDVRIAPPVDALGKDVPIEIAFDAVPPKSEDSSGQEFSLVVDHDRRGNSPETGKEGRANDDDSDDNSWKVTTLGSVLTRISVTPADTSVSDGQSIQYTATAVYSDSTTLDVTANATWSISPDSLGSFSVDGLLTTQNAGSGIVRAEYDSMISNSADLTVTPPQLQSLWIEPDGATLPLGIDQQFEARGAYSNGDTLTLTSGASWVLGDTVIASLSAPGFVESRQSGATDLSASFLGVFAPPVPVTITPPELSQIVVTPADTSLALGYDAQLTATGTYTDGSQQDVTNIVTWEALPSGVVDVGVTGLATTLSQGSATITATLDDVVSAPSDFTVLPPELVSLDGSPDSATIPSGSELSMTSLGWFSDGSSLDKTSDVNWSSSDTAVADFVAPGQLQAAAPGSIEVYHDYNGIDGDTLNVTVTSATLDSILVDPCPILLPSGVQQQMTATGYLSDDTTQDLTAQATWVVADTMVATISPEGLLWTYNDGITSLTASFASTTSSPCSITVDSAALDSLVIAPVSASVPLGLSAAFTATGYSGSNSFDLTSSVNWSAADTTIATISTDGTALSRGVGMTAIQADFSGVLASPATLNVDSAAVANVEVLPPSSTVRIRSSKRMTANAHYTDGSIVDVTSNATWASSAPSVVYVEADGLARGLSLGTAAITATFSGVLSPDASLQVLPAVELEALPVGSSTTVPGALDQVLGALRMTNHDIQSRELAALRWDVVGPATLLKLWLDDGNGIFETGFDTQLGAGVPSGGTWTATNLSQILGVAQSRTFFLSANVSLTQSSHGELLDAQVVGEGSVFWSSPTAVVVPAGFPLDSSGEVTVQDLVLAQLQFTTVPADTVSPGDTDIPVFLVAVPDDGGKVDVFEEMEIHQVGSAVSGSEINSLQLQRATGAATLPGQQNPAPPEPAPGESWKHVADFVHVGGGRWIATGFNVTLSGGSRSMRIVAALSTNTLEGRTLQFEMRPNALSFQSGRVGPVDGGRTNPQSTYVEEQNQIIVTQYTVSMGDVIREDQGPQPALGIVLEAQSATPDTLSQLRILHTSTGPSGDASDVDAQILEGQLWWDIDENGVGQTGVDVLLDVQAPGSVESGAFVFGSDQPLNVTLPVDGTVALLVELVPDRFFVRDSERLQVRLDQASDVVTSQGLPVILPAAMETQQPHIVDGQGAFGFDVRPQPGGSLPTGSTNVLVMDILLPANGTDADLLQIFRIENLGTATQSDVTRLRLMRDDGDEVPNSGDTEVATLNHLTGSTWAATNINALLQSGDPTRYFVLMDVAASVSDVITFQAQLPLNGVVVASDNEGPIDAAIEGGAPYIIAASDEVTWFAGSGAPPVVFPTANDETALTLAAFNGYPETRTLGQLSLTIEGDGLPVEFEQWKLYEDTDRNNSVNDGDMLLATARGSSGRLTFSDLGYDLISGQQQQLIVAFDLNPATVRDGTILNLLVQDAGDIVFESAPSGTQSSGDFPLDSTGNQTVDGLVAAQVSTNDDITPRTVGADQRDVLTLDFVVPSNGINPDSLKSLAIDLVDTTLTAVFPTDIVALNLWRESETPFDGSDFDPATDVFIGAATAVNDYFEFQSLQQAIPVGGQRFYVSVDMSSNPTDGALMRLVIPNDGIQMSSSNDGPLDQPILGSVTHQVSSGDLLPSLDVDPTQVSVGQTVSVVLQVLNQGSLSLDSITTLSLQAQPAGRTTLTSGPTPTYLNLGSGQSGDFFSQFSMDIAGEIQFSAVVGTSDSAVVSDPVQSSVIVVQNPPSGVSLDPLSTMPSSVNRGQKSVQFMVWQLQHPDAASSDPDSASADIAVDTLTIHFETAAAQPLSAANIIDFLQIGTGGQILATLNTIADDSVLAIPLTSPLLLAPGEVVSLPLIVDIDSLATAGDFRLRVGALDAIAASDFNSAQNVAWNAPQDWFTSAVSVLTVSTDIDLSVSATQPATVNTGQQDVSLARLTFSLPGAAGERQATLNALTLTATDSSGAALQTDSLFSGLRILNGTTSLLQTSELQSNSGRLSLALTTPQDVVSSTAETIEIFVDIAGDVEADHFELHFDNASDFEVNDANSGAPVDVALSGATFPWTIGRTEVQNPASTVTVVGTSTAPASTFPGAPGVPMLSFDIQSMDTPKQAASELVSVTLELVDLQGQPLPFESAVARIRLTSAGAGVADVVSPTGSQIVATLTSPILIQPQQVATLEAEVDLNVSVSVGSMRLQAREFTFEDGNDDTIQFTESSGLPFASTAVDILVAATNAFFGVVDGPPVNLMAGAVANTVLTFRVTHPGGANESSINLASMQIRSLNLSQQPLDPATFLSAARIVDGSASFDATFQADRLDFDLTGIGSIDAGQSMDVTLELDLAASTNVSDFHLALEATEVSIVAGGSGALNVQGLNGFVMPWMSPSLHISAASLKESYSSYPNPFTPGQSDCHITFVLPTPSRVSCEVYTLSGKLVRRLMQNQMMPAGLHDEMGWNGLNGAGEPVRNGTYLLCLRVNGETLIRKVAVIR